MRAKKTHTELRKEQIVRATLDLIAAEGVQALSIAGIAQRVGIVPSAVYRHYKGKDELLEAVLDMLRARLQRNVASVRQRHEGALERLRALLMRHARMLAEHGAIPHVIFSDGMYSGHPERKSKVRDIMTGYLREVENIVREGQEDGTIRADIAPKATSVMFLGMILPAAVLWTVSEGEFDAVAHVKNAWPVFEKAIAADA